MDLTFEQQKELIELEKKAKLEVEILRHKNRIEEIVAELKSKKEAMRIKTAEIKKHYGRKSNYEMLRNSNN